MFVWVRHVRRTETFVAHKDASHAPIIILVLIMTMLMFPSDCTVSGSRLGDDILHHEKVHYTMQSARYSWPSARLRRSVSQGSPVRFQFRALGRHFRVHIQPDTSIFSEDVEFFSGNRSLDFARSSVFSGVLEGDDDAGSVTGVIGTDGLFDGVINTATQIFYLEPASRYAAHISSSLLPARHHSVLYRASDVRAPLQATSRCNHDQLDIHRQQSLTSSNKSSIRETSSRRRRRFRRSASERLDTPLEKTTCTLYLQADHLFLQQMGSEEEAMQVMIRHVQQVNQIYKFVDFDSDGLQDNIGFIIKRMRVHNADSLNDPNYRYAGNFDVKRFLETFSEENYNSFCLAYMFTHRDFDSGTLGLAWTADLQQPGGVCQRNGLYQGRQRSLNTGVISLLNYGKRVSPAISHVTFAHELGHSFGSKHDPEDNAECTPGGAHGNYLMYARATSGDKLNNKRFSPCSLRSIGPVLRAKAVSKQGCFIEAQAAICGNGVVERGEECDCGWEQDCHDTCCHAMSVSPRRAALACTLTSQADCSPSQGACCDSQCRHINGSQCRDDNGCRLASMCDGRSSQCPASVLRPDTTVCGARNVCYRGECSGSICLAYGLQSCQCVNTDDTTNTHPTACHLCCKLPGSGHQCRSSFEWNLAPYNVPDQFLSAGSACGEYMGYCDVFNVCREVDPVGPLATVKLWLLSDRGLSVVKQLVDSYWYIIVLVLLIIILLLVAVIRIFGKSTHYGGRRPRHRRKSHTRRRSTPHHRHNPNVAVAAAAGDNQAAGSEAVPRGGGRLSRAVIGHLLGRRTQRPTHREQIGLDGGKSSNGKRRNRSDSRPGKRRRRDKQGVTIISYTNRAALNATDVRTDVNRKEVSDVKTAHASPRVKSAAASSSVNKASDTAETVVGAGRSEDRGRSSRRRAEYRRSLSHQVLLSDKRKLTAVRSRSSSPGKKNSSQQLRNTTGDQVIQAAEQMCAGPDANNKESVKCGVTATKPAVQDSAAKQRMSKTRHKTARTTDKTKLGGERCHASSRKQPKVASAKKTHRKVGHQKVDDKRQPHSEEQKNTRRVLGWTKPSSRIASDNNNKNKKKKQSAAVSAPLKSHARRRRASWKSLSNKLMQRWFQQRTAADQVETCKTALAEKKAERANQQVIQWLLNSAQQSGVSESSPGSIASPLIDRKRSASNTFASRELLLRPDDEQEQNQQKKSSRQDVADHVDSAERSPQVTRRGASEDGVCAAAASSKCVSRTSSTTARLKSAIPVYRRSVSHGNTLTAAQRANMQPVDTRAYTASCPGSPNHNRTDNTY